MIETQVANMQVTRENSIPIFVPVSSGEIMNLNSVIYCYIRYENPEYSIIFISNGGKFRHLFKYRESFKTVEKAQEKLNEILRNK